MLIIPFVLGGMGGGDVKLLAALGSWLGFPAVLKVFFYGAATGAVIALFLVVVKKHRLRPMSVLDDIVYFFLTKERPAQSNEVEGFCYSVPVAAGFVAYVIFS